MVTTVTSTCAPEVIHCIDKEQQEFILKLIDKIKDDKLRDREIHKILELMCKLGYYYPVIDNGARV